MGKFKGMGGHMTAALLHEIDVLYRVYDIKIADAWMHNHSHQAQQLADLRDAKIRKIKDRLAERGYQYTMRERRSVKVNDGEKAFIAALAFAEFMRSAA